MDMYARRRQSLARALVVSLAFAICTPFALVVAFADSIEAIAPTDLAAFDALSYEKQQEWLKQRTRQVSGLAELKNRLSHTRFWTQEYVPTALGTFAVVFLACATFAVWDRRDLRSNNTPHTDARASSVLDQTPSARAGERGR
jgi:hypothetical protein